MPDLKYSTKKKKNYSHFKFKERTKDYSNL